MDNPFESKNPLPAEPKYPSSHVYDDEGESDSWEGIGPLVQFDRDQVNYILLLMRGHGPSEIRQVILAQIYEAFPDLNPDFVPAQSPVDKQCAYCHQTYQMKAIISWCQCGRAYDLEGHRVKERDTLPLVLTGEEA